MDIAAVRCVVAAAVGAGELIEGLGVVSAGQAKRPDVDLAVAVQVADDGGRV